MEAEKSGKVVPNDGNGVAVVTADASVVTAGNGAEEPKENNDAVGALNSAAK